MLPTSLIKIRSALLPDREAIAQVITAAFSREGAIIVDLVNDLIKDPTAQPVVSLVATLQENSGEEVVGYILFSNAWLEGGDRSESIAILAPLCVHPNYQKQGIGGQLIEDAVQRLTAAGVEIAFLLGYPSYYPRHQFSPAGKQGFEPTYPVPPKDASAWMLRELKPGAAESRSGKVICADALNAPQHWQE
ncbi:MAG: GNAT family N-acetyltransferase [Cyanophyceae cyanobacterium]